MEWSWVETIRDDRQFMNYNNNKKKLRQLGSRFESIRTNTAIQANRCDQHLAEEQTITAKEREGKERSKERDREETIKTMQS